MYTVSYAMLVNPASEDVVLTQDDLWLGLTMKAEDALPFVPSVTRCEIIDRGADEGQPWILRNMEAAGRKFQEKVTLRAPTQLHFALSGGAGFIENTISTSDDGLQLAFTFGLSMPGCAPGTLEERQAVERLKDNHLGAVATTLTKVREMKRTGQLFVDG